MWLFVIALIVFAIFIWNLNKEYYILALCKRVKTVDGQAVEKHIKIHHGKTIFGNNFDLFNLDSAKSFQYMRDICQMSSYKSVLLHFLRAPVYMIYNAEDAEGVLQSNALITKSAIYELVRPFLGDGLLISTKQKWHFRRKTLTPAFHFNILQTFLEIFKEESYKFIKHVNEQLEYTTELILSDFIPSFTLNNICETALGVKLDELSESDQYRRSIHHIETVIVKRTSNPLLYFNIIFKLMAYKDYKEQKQHLRIAHEFSSKIIEKRREEFRKRIKTNTEDFINEYGKKKRYAMLDTLLHVEEQGLITHTGICEEVDTFMFEGYDTTSTCLMFTLLNLAQHADIQEKCYQEIVHLPATPQLTVFDYNKLEYLECVIKEALRLYPPVPFLARACENETEINGLIFPPRAQINIHVFDILRDPKHFTNPSKFDPERFLADTPTQRNPFAFIPFSAGPRNCIGQKFAMLEMKVLLIEIIKKFILHPITRPEELILESGLVLRTLTPLKVKFVKRSQK